MQILRRTPFVQFIHCLGVKGYENTTFYRLLTSEMGASRNEDRIESYG